MNEIKSEINRLQQEDLTYANCAKLADLLIIQERFKGTAAASYSYGQSEFLQAIKNKPIEGVLSVLDEHMECIKMLYPKEYNIIINKVEALN